jgi:hypothetical protein
MRTRRGCRPRISAWAHLLAVRFSWFDSRLVRSLGREPRIPLCKLPIIHDAASLRSCPLLPPATSGAELLCVHTNTWSHDVHSGQLYVVSGCNILVCIKFRLRPSVLMNLSTRLHMRHLFRTSIMDASAVAASNGHLLPTLGLPTASVTDELPERKFQSFRKTRDRAVGTNVRGFRLSSQSE